MISAEAATLHYSDHGKDVYACRAINLEIHPGEFVGILGPSGSGKSSLLYLLSGLKLPTSGTVKFENQVLSQMSDSDRSNLRLREFGFVFQQPYLLGYLTALENILIAGGRDRSPEKEVQASTLLDRLGLASKAQRRPHELSGGERQRVCVARALLGKPRAIFADEPTASLDHVNGVQVVEMLRENRGEGALIMVTHDPTMLDKADRIIKIVEGELEG